MTRRTQEAFARWTGFVSLRDQTIQGGIRVVRFSRTFVFFSCLAAMLVAGQRTAVAQQTVLLDFWLPTCGPCRAMDPIVERLQAEGFPIRRVDGSREVAVAQRFGVQRYPTFVLVSGGREIHRSVGPMSYGQMRGLMLQAGAGPIAKAPARGDRSPVVPATFAGPAPNGGAAYQVGSDLGPAPAVTIPGVRDSVQQPATFGPPSAQPIASQGPDPNRLLSVSVRIKVEDGSGSSYGTGTIIDTRQGEALVLTCAHLFREGAGPVSSSTPIVVELFGPTAGGVRVVERPAGQIISYDMEKDVALVSIRPRVPVQAVRVASNANVASIGGAVWSVGCDHGADPSVRTGQITTIAKYTSPPSLTATGAPVVGRSGGGLFNERGELVGVCFGASEPDNEGFYAKLSSVHAELDKLGLSGVYRTGEPSPQSGMVAVAAAADPTVPANPGAGMVPVESNPPVPAVVRGQDAAPAAVSLQGLSAAERAAIQELSSRAAESEVVCVIRPKEPGGRSEVITLDHVSPAFLQALQAMRGVSRPR